MKKKSLAGLVILAVAASGDVAAASQAGVPMLESLPNWVVYVGLAVVCPEDLNDAISSRLGRDG